MAVIPYFLYAVNRHTTETPQGKSDDVEILCYCELSFQLTPVWVYSTSFFKTVFSLEEIFFMLVEEPNALPLQYWLNFTFA